MHAVINPSQLGTWNGWTDSQWNSALPTLAARHKELTHALTALLVTIPIQGQEVTLYALWDVDAWSVSLRPRLSSSVAQDPIAIPCLIDFDQYKGRIAAIRQDTAAALAEAVMDQRFPGWQDPEYGQPESAWEEDWRVR